MDNIPTVQEFFNQFGGYTREEMLNRAKEFAKLHVEFALKAASEVELDDISLMPEANDFEESRQISILNAYPLSNIK